MTKIERVELLSSKRDILYLLALFSLLFTLSLSYEYYSYKKLTEFDSALVQAKVLKQYLKTKVTKDGKIKSYQVLKLKTDGGLSFYTIASKKTPNYKDKNILLEIQTAKINFLSYLKSFFAFSKIIQTQTKESLKQSLSHYLSTLHQNKNISAIYEALFLAKPLPYHLQQLFSKLGISHLLAISGFHLGVLSTILFFILKYPYKLLQNRYFPYRSSQRDIFFLVALLLFAYTLFLEYPPSLLRAFIMLLVTFFLYEKGIKIISMQTLFITALLIIALFPRLLFSTGLFLSLSGVFYIFLFLIYFKSKSRLWQFVVLPFWVYLMMLPYSLVLFGNFSLYHPLSIIWTSLFSLFYPLTIALHCIGFGDILDRALEMLLDLQPHALNIKLHSNYLFIEIVLSIMAIFKKEALLLLLLYTLSVFVYSIYHVT